MLKGFAVRLCAGDKSLIARNMINELCGSSPRVICEVLQRVIDARLAGRLLIHDMRFGCVSNLLPIIEFVVCDSNRRFIEMRECVLRPLWLSWSKEVCWSIIR